MSVFASEFLYKSIYFSILDIPFFFIWIVWNLTISAEICRYCAIFSTYLYQGKSHTHCNLCSF